MSSFFSYVGSLRIAWAIWERWWMVWSSRRNGGGTIEGKSLSNEWWRWESYAQCTLPLCEDEQV